LTLPEVGPEANRNERIVSLSLLEVDRVVASLRDGLWNDPSAYVRPFSLDELDAVVGSFEVQPIYGWRFFDVDAATFDQLGDRISLDISIPKGRLDHTLDLFQESGAGPARHLDLRLWFGDLRARGHDGRALVLDEVAAGASRWWDAMYQGDPRVQGHGIVPAGPWPGH
jgi:hypothetical protein